MGLLTLADYRAEVDAALGAPGLGNTVYDRYTNIAYYDVCGSYRFPEFIKTQSVSLVNATDVYSLTEIPLAVDFVVHANTTLRFLPANEFFRRHTATTGTPKNWTWYGASIAFDPTPNASSTATAHKRVEPAKLTNTIDASVIPTTWDSVILDLAVAHLLARRGENDRALAMFQQAVTLASAKHTPELYALMTPGTAPFSRTAEAIALAGAAARAGTTG